MKKKIGNIVACLLAAGMLVGCGSDNVTSLKDMDVEKYVTLGEYKGIEVSVDPVTVDVSQVEGLVAQAYNSAVTAEAGGVVDRVVAVGDTANIDYVGKKDGVAFDGGTAQGYNLTIGSGSFIDGFEDGLVGVMPGETVDLNLTFPEGYGNAELAGADVVFTVTVNYLMPSAEERTDAAVPNLGIEGVNTLEDLELYANEYLLSNAENNYKAAVENAVLTNFMNACVFEEIPQPVIDKYADLARNGVTSQAQSMGTDVETFVTYFYNMTLEEFLENYSVEAAKQDIALQAVANRENLNVTEEELETILQEYATNSGFATVEEYLRGESRETYRDYLVCDKAYNFLMENAVVTENAQ